VKVASIVAYLTISDHQCGIFLIPSDENSHININFVSPLTRTDFMVPDITDHRFLEVDLVLNDEMIPTAQATLDKVQTSWVETNDMLVTRKGNVHPSEVINARNTAEASGGRQWRLCRSS
jgi:hypothetical protein